MAYRDDLIALGLNHLYTFDGNINDSVGTSNGTNSGCILTGTAITEDASNCLTSNGTVDRVTLPSVATINNSAQTRFAYGGWVELTAIQPPPKRLFGTGGTGTYAHFVSAFGNNVMAEVSDGTRNIQIYGPVLQPNRVYHLLLIFSGSGFNNKVDFYVDGILQTNAQPSNREWGATSLAARGAGEFCDPAGTVEVGDEVVLLNAPVNGNFQHWFFCDAANAELSASEIRETIFEGGALPDNTISSATESIMQTSLNSLTGTVRPNAPLCIRVEANTGDTDFTLAADNITFNQLASTHVQYMGTSTLTWENLNGSNAAIFSTPNGGTIDIRTETNLNINGLVSGTEVRIYNQFGDAAVEIAGVESSSTSFSTATTENTVDITIINTNYRLIQLIGVDLTSGDVSITVSQEDNKVYLNP